MIRGAPPGGRRGVGDTAETAWNQNAIDLARASKAHCFYILLSNFNDAVNTLPASPLRTILKALCDLFALNNVERFLGDFVDDGCDRARAERGPAASRRPGADFRLRPPYVFRGGAVGTSRYMNRRQIALLREQARALLATIRPNAVALVDAWSFHDYELNSALGRYDGDVYQALYDWAKRNPVNAKHTGRGYEEYLKPKFTSNL